MDVYSGESVSEAELGQSEKDVFRLCIIADYAEILKIEGVPSNKACKKQRWILLSIPCGDAERPTSVEGKVDNYYEDLFQEAEVGQSKKYIFSTKKDARALLWKCQARAILRCWFG